MYCPHCGQQQVSSEVRFCSRCGFPLAGVTQLLASGGALPVVRDESDKSELSPKQRGIRRGVLLWLIGAFIVPFLAVILPWGNPRGSIIGAAAIICFVGGLVRLLYALMFQQDFPTSSNQINAAPPQPYSPPVQIPNARPTAQQLPPRPTVVENAAPRRVNTGELISPPPSVTDHTTQLLGEKQTPRG